MRDGEQAAGVRRPAPLQMPGQPGDRLHVQVVGRLVEHEHVPLAYEQSGQVDASALTAGQGADRRIPVQIGDQAREHLAGAAVAGPLVLGSLADDRAADGGGVRQRVGLPEHPHAHAAAHGHAPAVGAAQPGEQREQARLPVAVAADHADAVALVHSDRDRVEDDAGRILQVQGLGPEQMRHVAFQGRSEAAAAEPLPAAAPSRRPREPARRRPGLSESGSRTAAGPGRAARRTRAASR